MTSKNIAGWISLIGICVALSHDIEAASFRKEAKNDATTQRQAGPVSKYQDSKLDPALVAYLASSGGFDAADGPWIDVVYILPSGAGAAGGRGDGDLAGFASANDQMTDRLRSTGHEIVYSSDIAGMIVARGTVGAIRAMESDAGVERIYLERTHRNRLNLSRLVSQGDVVNNLGTTGDGVLVAVIEEGRIAPHAALPPSRRLLCRPESSLIDEGHKTAIAGIIQSHHADAQGLAPNVMLIDAIGLDLSDAEMIAATDCALLAGASVLNMSFGTDTLGEFDAFARYVDRITHVSGSTVVVAVSNECDLPIGSPEVAFNALGVGSYSDRNTLTPQGDRHSCHRLINEAHSAFIDPASINFDRQEPKMVAPGHQIRTTNERGGFSNVNGTSFAAPHVTAAAALLIGERPELAEQGELVRAILMASARKNVDGASGVSDRDGAGALLLAAANRVLSEGDAAYVVTPGAEAGFPIERTFFARRGERVRVALVWSHKTTGSEDFQPTTDLDLGIAAPDGELIVTSVSFDNAYELVEFVAPATGDYSALVENFRPSEGEEYLGLAVSRFFK